jgi:hypothetical protein
MRSLCADDALSVERPITLELRGSVEQETVSNADACARQVDAFSATIEGEAALPVPGWGIRLKVNAIPV